MTAVVDVHCHTFNADDLPVRGFIHRLYLRKAVLGGALSELVDELLQGGAPGYRADLGRLNLLLGADEELEASAVLEAPAPEQFEREVDVAMAELQGRDPDLLQRVGAALAEEEASDANGAEALGDVFGFARRAVRWVKLFGRSRLDLVADLVRDSGDEVDLGPAPVGTGCRGEVPRLGGNVSDRSATAAPHRRGWRTCFRSAAPESCAQPAPPGAERRPPHRRGLAGAAAVSAPALAAAVWVAIPKPTRGDRPPATVQGDEPPDRQLLL